RPTFNIELELHRLDCLSSHGKLDIYEFLKDKMQNNTEISQLPKPLVNGEDLKKMGFVEGIELGKALNEIREKQLSDELTTREQALEYARKLLTNKSTNQSSV
ncbi:MAG TPA: CCA tRNA nucleotidyltransferase, partial [Verrucomicrobiota bacterium]|nr:CCA tRNA nucleotidyltransferase [Verrucomicrobiota bacterium]